MVPWLKRLLWDEAAFERYARFVLLGVAGLAVTGDLPAWVPSWVVALLMALAGLIGAGDKNEAKS